MKIKQGDDGKGTVRRSFEIETDDSVDGGGVTDAERERYLEMFRKMTGNTMTFEVTRTKDAMDRNPEHSFSEGALERMYAQMTIFAGSRMMAFWDVAKKPPTTWRVTVHVEVE